LVTTSTVNLPQDREREGREGEVYPYSLVVLTYLDYSIILPLTILFYLTDEGRKGRRGEGREKGRE